MRNLHLRVHVRESIRIFVAIVEGLHCVVVAKVVLLAPVGLCIFADLQAPAARRHPCSSFLVERVPFQTQLTKKGCLFPCHWASEKKQFHPTCLPLLTLALGSIHFRALSFWESPARTSPALGWLVGKLRKLPFLG